MAENNGIQNQTRISFRKKLSLIIFGLLISFVLLEAGLRLGGFIISSLQEDRNQASLKQKASYRIMCLGESTTAMGGRYSYPSQLEMVLNERDEGMKFSVINKGIPATDSSMILLLLNDNLAKYKPDMVIVMMGINDKEKQFSKEYRSTLKFFLKSFKTYNLMRLLQFNIMAKIQELCYFWLKNKYFYRGYL